MKLNKTPLRYRLESTAGVATKVEVVLGFEGEVEELLVVSAANRV